MLKKIISRLRAIGFRPRPVPYADAASDDPLAHPVLRRMTPRELADIPFPRP